jgi:CheY-like chemotaxis protein/two-component sensor histidine kinase
MVAIASLRHALLGLLILVTGFVVVAGRFSVRPLARLASRAQMQRDLVVAATEAERARLAADIHDDALQELTLLVRRLEATGDEEGAELGRTVAERLRAICGDLRLPILDDLGVGPALDWLVLRIERLAGGEVRLERADGTRPPPDVELAFFRVAQEALANAVKHGQPPIVVRYRATESGASLSVDDAGPGIEPDAGAVAERGGHFGLLNMQQRAEAIGAILDVRRWPGGGDARRAGVAGALTEAAPEPTRVAIVDDHPVLREGTAALLARQPGLSIVGVAGTVEDAETLLATTAIDVVLLDIRLGSDSGLRPVVLRARRGPARDRRPDLVRLPAIRRRGDAPWARGVRAQDRPDHGADRRDPAGRVGRDGRSERRPVGAVRLSEARARRGAARRSTVARTTRSGRGSGSVERSSRTCVACSSGWTPARGTELATRALPRKAGWDAAAWGRDLRSGRKSIGEAAERAGIELGYEVRGPTAGRERLGCRERRYEASPVRCRPWRSHAPTRRAIPAGGVLLPAR